MMFCFIDNDGRHSGPSGTSSAHVLAEETFRDESYESYFEELESFTLAEDDDIILDSEFMEW